MRALANGIPRRLVFFSFASMAIASAGCHDNSNTVVGPDPTRTPSPTIAPPLTTTNSPTKTPPPSPSVTPTAVPTPASSGILDGNWIGTFHETGRTDEFFCPGRTTPVTAIVSGDGNVVNIEISSASGCSRAGATVFAGTLSGTSLGGILHATVPGTNGCELVGSAHGSGEQRLLHLEGSMSGKCNSVTVTIDLSR